MRPILLPLLAAAGTAAVISTKPPEPSGKWKTQQLSRYFWAEGACVADINQDGHPDVLSGPFWFEGPGFTVSHAIYPAEETFAVKTAEGEEKLEGFEGALGIENAYADNFISFAHDFNGDGFPDYLVFGFPGKETFWYENPAGKGDGKWKRHVAIEVTDNESPTLTDINGNGRPDLLAMSGGTIGFASYDPEKPEAPWVWQAITPENGGAYQRYTHGLGYGDINGDGRIDILEAKGWWEQPADWDGKTPWVRHDVDFGRGGAQMFGYDVNGNGRTDVITSLAAHEFGVAWFEQNEDGTWTRHLLTDTPEEKGSTGVAFSQPHALELADVDGDGLKDIITGKRFWAHGSTGDVEPNEAAVVYAFLLSRDGDGKASYTAELIHADSGIGCQVMGADLNSDGNLDIISANKKGCFVHIRQ